MRGENRRVPKGPDQVEDGRRSQAKQEKKQIRDTAKLERLDLETGYANTEKMREKGTTKKAQKPF